jgi:hypothetical protein
MYRDKQAVRVGPWSTRGARVLESRFRVRQFLKARVFA